MNQKFDITTASIIRIILILLGVWFLFYIRDVLVLLFITLIVVAGLSPTVDRWSRSLTRPGAVISVFLLFFAILAVIISLILPPLIHQLQDFSTYLPNLADFLSRSETNSSGFVQTVIAVVRENLSQLTAQLSNLGGSLLSRTFGFLSGLVAVATVIVLSFYLLLEEEGMRKMYRGLLPEELHENLTETTRKIAEKLGAWLRGQLMLMLIVSLLDVIGLAIIGVPYALTLGIWAGLTESIPFVGPFIGAVPGVAIGLSQSPIHGLLALLIYIVVQQIENNFLVPKIVGKAVGLNPVVVILAILIGGKLYGLLGIIIAVPLAAVISVVVEDWEVIRTTFTTPHRRT